MTDWFAEISGSAPQAQAASKAGGPVDWYTALTTRSGAGEIPPHEREPIRQDPYRGVGVGRAAVAGLVNDPERIMDFYARSMGIPRERFGTADGQIVYRRDDGQLQAAQPKGYHPYAMAQRAGDAVTRGIPAVTGATAGVLATPLSPPVQMGAAAAGGALGEGIRQGAAKLIVGQEPTVMPFVQAGAENAVGQGIGIGLTKFAQRNAVRDIARLDRPGADAAVKNAQGWGIDLTPAESTGLASLKAQQKYLGNTPRSSDTMQDFYARRNGQVQDAIQKFLTAISPQDSAELAGRNVQKAAQGAIDSRIAARRAQAKPLYDAAEAANPAMDSARLQELSQTPAGKVAAKRAMAMMRDDLETVSPGTAQPLKFWDYFKRAYDDMTSKAGRAGANNEARIYGNRAKDVRDELDALDVTKPAQGGPGKYQQARDAYAGRSPEIDQLREGMIGSLAELGPERYGKAAQMLFGPNSGPMAIADAKGVLKQASPEAWQGLKRAWLQDVFEKSAQEYASAYGAPPNVAGKFWSALEGNKAANRRLAAALEPGEMAAFKSLSDALKRAGSVKPIGSDTAWNEAVKDEAKEMARPWFAKIVGNANPMQLARNADEWLTNRAMSKQAEEMAAIVTAPGALEKLKTLQMLPPSSIRYRAVLGHLLSYGGARGGEALLGSEPADQIPSRFE